MSGYILCKVPRAKTPYYVNRISTNIYSIEELCYHFTKNLWLVDQSVMNRELCSWLQDELQLEELARKLLAVLQKEEADIRNFVYPVFKEINYLSYEDMKQYDARVTKMEALTVPRRLKGRGDALVKNGLYVDGIQAYRSILREYEEEEEDSFLSNVYFNMGCAYEYLFQREDALECFERAYMLVHTMDTLVHYLYAFYYAKTPIEYSSKLEELGVDQKTRGEIQRKISQVENSDEPTILDYQIDEILDGMIKDYRRSTGA